MTKKNLSARVGAGLAAAAVGAVLGQPPAVAADAPADQPARAQHGDDLLVSTESNDTLRGTDGNDTLRGSDGNDVLVGTDGNDTLRGSAAGDEVLAG